MSSVNSDKQLYALWLQKHSGGLLDARYAGDMQSLWPRQPLVHIVLILDRQSDQFVADFVTSLSAQSYENWKLTVFAAFPALSPDFDQIKSLEWVVIKDKVHWQQPVTQCVDSYRAEWVIPITETILPAANCLLSYMSYIHQHPNWKLVYGDSDELLSNGSRVNPTFWPDFNLDLFYTTAYLGNFCLVKRELFLEYAQYADTVDEVNARIVISLIEQQQTTAIGHIADILSHRCGKAGATRNCLHSEAYREQLTSHLRHTFGYKEIQVALNKDRLSVIYPRTRTPEVSIVIHSKESFDGLRNCVSNIVSNTVYKHYQLIIVNPFAISKSIKCAIRELCQSQTSNINLRFQECVEGVRELNKVMRESSGELFIYLDVHVRVKDGAWLDRLLCYGLREDVAVVAPYFIDTESNLRSGGAILGGGSDGIADAVQPIRPSINHSGTNLLLQTHNVSSVSSECFMVKKQVFTRIDGYQQNDLPLIYANVDLCLRANALGYRAVVVPDVIMQLTGGDQITSVRNTLKTDEVDQVSYNQGMEQIIKRWLPKLRLDPFYNRNLSLMDQASCCDVEMDARWDSEIKVVPRVVGMSAGSEGSRMYRMTLPFLALESAKLAQASLIPKYTDHVRVPSVAELERMSADALVLHNTVHDGQLKAIADYQKFNRIRMIYSQDDLMINLPKSNPFHKTVYKDIEKRLAEGMSHCDCLLVTTEPLAQAYSHFTSNIHIVPNYLQGSVWLNQNPRKYRSGKPRVGWVGAQQHGADIALLYETIQATHKEVDWIFMGMCAKEFLPYVKEVHNPVSYEQYPQKLASLNLDIGLAPLEINPFNEAKSNLKILEYGVLGIPVICSNIFPYQGGAPVTRIENRSEEWIKAIRDHITDQQTMLAFGQNLRRWVERFYILEDHLQEWSKLLFGTEKIIPEDHIQDEKQARLGKQHRNRGLL